MTMSLVGEVPTRCVGGFCGMLTWDMSVVLQFVG